RTLDAMQAIVVEEGKPLAIAELPDPEVGSSDVLIDVEAAGLNRADLAQRGGGYPPPPGASEILGLEVAGVVAEVGSAVTEWHPGDRVCALLAGGGYATRAVADEGSVFRIPDGIGMADAACLPEAMMTVWANVYLRCGFRAGESFLMHGGTSGIGVMGIQMAKHAGASAVYATAGSDDKVALCRDLGADVGINYRTEDFVEVVKERGGVDVILDLVGGDYIQRNITAASLNGRICNIAYQSGFVAEVNFGPVMMKRLTLTATTLRARTTAEKRAIRDAVLADFWPAVADGGIRTVVDRTFPLAEADAAQASMEAGGHAGKIVLLT
ncbi:MAG: NAD(P)H-quinone oxidoreductase, partial [Acidimicrobiales bacterium]